MKKYYYSVFTEGIRDFNTDLFKDALEEYKFQVSRDNKSELVRVELVNGTCKTLRKNF